MLGSAAVNALLMLLLILWKKSLAVWGAFCSTFVRTAMVVLVFTLMEQKAAGFESMDPKRMHDAITYISMPALLLFAHNFKIELCLTIPLLIVANMWTIKSSYRDTGSNMDGFVDPEGYPSVMAFRSTIVLIVVFLCIFDTRRNQIHLFLER